MSKIIHIQKWLAAIPNARFFKCVIVPSCVFCRIKLRSYFFKHISYLGIFGIDTKYWRTLQNYADTCSSNTDTFTLNQTKVPRDDQRQKAVLAPSCWHPLLLHPDKDWSLESSMNVRAILRVLMSESNHTSSALFCWPCDYSKKWAQTYKIRRNHDGWCQHWVDMCCI